MHSPWAQRTLGWPSLAPPTLPSTGLLFLNLNKMYTFPSAFDGDFSKGHSKHTQPDLLRHSHCNSVCKLTGFLPPILGASTKQVPHHQHFPCKWQVCVWSYCLQHSAAITAASLFTLEECLGSAFKWQADNVPVSSRLM